MKKLLLICSIFLFGIMVSCGVLPQKNNFYTTKSSVEIGVIGEKQKSIYKTTFQSFANPKYVENIKVSVSKEYFTKKTYKQYKKAVTGKKSFNSAVLNDSLYTNQNFITIRLENKVGVVTNLNENKDVFNYLRKTPEALLVSAIRLVPSQELLNLLKNVDAVYLRTDKQTKQLLFLYKKGKEIESIDISKQLVFGYELSSFCWETTLRKKIKIATIVRENQNCSVATKKSPQELEEELTKSSFKF